MAFHLSTGAVETSRFDRRYSGGYIRCVLTVACGGFSVSVVIALSSHSLVSRVLSSTLLPGFTGPGSSVLSTNLPPSAPYPSRDLLFGSGLWYIGNFYYHRRRASLGKTHHLSICRPTSPWFGSPDIRSRSATPARPPCHSHIVGSLFATYTDSASCFLRTPHYW